MKAQRGLWDFLYPPTLEGGPQQFMPPPLPPGCSTPTEQPVQPQFGLGVGPGVSDVPSPWGQPAAGDGGTRDGGRIIFSPAWACAAAGCPAPRWGCGAQKAKG